GAHCFAASTTGTRIGFCPLSTAREIPPMAETAIGPDVDETSDIGLNFTAKIAFDFKATRADEIADFVDLAFRQIFHARAGIDLRFGHQLRSHDAADAIDIRQRNIHALIFWKIYTRNTCHKFSPSTQFPRSGW